jgi:hypothetical protein
MRTMSRSWATILTKLGFRRIKPQKKRGVDYRRTLRFESCEDRRMLAPIIVTSDQDNTISGDGLITLREAINAANDTIQHDTIKFDETFFANGGTINLTQGQLSISQGVTIDGNDTTGESLDITIDAGDGTDMNPGTGDGHRVFEILGGAEVTMQGLTLTGGDASINALHNGGAIYTTGVLTLQHTTITGNTGRKGGAIYQKMANYGVNARTILTIEDSDISNNRAAEGGGISIHSATNDTTADSVVISRSTITGNDAIPFDPQGITGSGNGGGIYAQLSAGSELEINEGSVIHGNTAKNNGGGIFLNVRSTVSSGTLTISNSFVSGNISQTSNGGGLYAIFAPGGDMTIFANKGVFISDSTISGNHALGVGGDGGGVFVGLGSLDPDSHYVAKELQFLMTRSIVDNNKAANRGGGMFVTGAGGSEITIRDSRVSGNEAGLGFSNPYPDLVKHYFSGGGIYASSVSGPEDVVYGSDTNPALVAHIIISGTTINNNQAGVDGGGVLIFTKRGGALPGTFGMYNSTISGNTAGRPNNPVPSQGRGGGIHLATFDAVANADEGIDARFHNVTVTLNTAGTGGGMYVMRPLVSTHALTAMDVRLKNTIVSENEDHGDDPNNYWGCINAGETEFSLFGPTNTFAHHNNPHPFLTLQEVDDLFDQLVTGNIFNDTNDPLLAVLSNNGGGFVLPDQSHLLTHRPKVGSPVIDNGSNDLADEPFTGIPLTIDQRGGNFARIVDVPSVNNNANLFTVDIGAVEFDTALPPKVINVTISSWSATNPHTPHTFNNPTDDINDFDGSGIQLKTVPVGNADTITIQFSEHVNVVDTSLKLYGLVFASRPALATLNAFSYVNNTATWRFATPFAADQYLIWLSDTVTNAAGTPLDGDWVNPASRSTSNSLVSEFPSGNNIAGGDFKFVFVALPGDADLGNTVGGRDFLIWQRNTSGTGHTFQQADFNGDGLTNSTDLAFYQANYGLNLIALRIAGDFDGDFIVDTGDLGIWQSNYGTGTTHVQGDADWDGDVDGRDFLIWQRQFGIQIDVAV